MNYTVIIGNEPKKVPETVKYYNSSKYGVDVWTKWHNYIAKNVVHDESFASTSIL